MKKTRGFCEPRNGRQEIFSRMTPQEWAIWHGKGWPVPPRFRDRAIAAVVETAREREPTGNQFNTPHQGKEHDSDRRENHRI